MSEEKAKQPKSSPKRYGRRSDMWLTCPACKEKFSIPFGWVEKYIDRLVAYVNDLETKLKESAANLKQRRQRDNASA